MPNDEFARHFESSPHVNRDAGFMPLAVRRDVAAAIAAAGDYHPLLVDANGRLHVSAAFAAGGVVGISAGEEHIGEVGGAATLVSANPVLTVAGAYGANDYVGTSAAAMAFASAVRVAGGTGIIHSAVLIDAALQSLPLELWLFDTNITPPNDNAAWTLTDAHAATCIGVIPFNTYYASALNSVSVQSGLGIAFRAVATTIWGVLVTRGAPTYASLDLTIRLQILQD